MQHELLHYMQHWLLHYMRYRLLHYMQHWSLHYLQHWLLHFIRHCLVHVMWSFVNTVIVSSHWSLLFPHSHSVEYIVFNSYNTSFFEVQYSTWIRPFSQVKPNLHTSADEHLSFSAVNIFNGVNIFNSQVLQQLSSSTFKFFNICVLQNSQLSTWRPACLYATWTPPCWGGYRAPGAIHLLRLPSTCRGGSSSVENAGHL